MFINISFMCILKSILNLKLKQLYLLIILLLIKMLFVDFKYAFQLYNAI